MKDEAFDDFSSAADPARGPSQKSRAKGDWLERVDDYCWVSKLLRGLQLEVPFWILHWDGKRGLTFMDLNEAGARVPPFHFEMHFGKDAKRDEYCCESLERAARERRLVVGELMGFDDFFYPLPADARGRTFFYGGQFLTQELDWDGLAWRWRELSGRLPASTDPDFLRFVRLALRVPVIDPAMLKAIEQLFSLVSELVSGQPADVRLHERIRKLKRALLDPARSSRWALRATAPDTSLLTPGPHEGKLEAWRCEDLGICRLPTTAMALMPVYPKNHSEDLPRTLLKNAQIQRACLRFIGQMPETAASRLEDYGVSILTSAVPGKSLARAKLELAERAQKLQAFVQETFGVSAAVGIGRTVSPGEPLHSSLRDAVLALHECVQVEKQTSFYEEEAPTGPGMRYALLDQAATELAEAFDSGAHDRTKLAADRYVRLVLVWSEGRVEVVRSQLLSMLFLVLKNIQKRHLLRNEVAQQLTDELSARLEAAPSSYRTIEVFNDSLSRLGVFAARALEGPKSMRLDATLQYLADNFAEPLRLTSVARKAGFSVPAFSRIFKQATGTSFLVYLRNIRVEHAKTLLRTSTSSAEQIAQACGFQSQHHLIRSFKKVTKSTPGNYRKDAQTRAVLASRAQH